MKYFWILLFIINLCLNLLIFSLLVVNHFLLPVSIPYSNIVDYLYLIFGVIILIGLYGLAFDKKILFGGFWFVIFLLILVVDLFYPLMDFIQYRSIVSETFVLPIDSDYFLWSLISDWCLSIINAIGIYIYYQYLVNIPVKNRYKHFSQYPLFRNNSLQISHFTQYQ